MATLPSLLFVLFLTFSANLYAQLNWENPNPGEPPGGPGSGGLCQNDKECSDNNICTTDRCLLGKCEYANAKGGFQTCFTGQPGICSNGTQTCANGKLGACLPDKEPTAEICDGLDNNCNGETDEKISETCYTGPAGTENVGICTGGTRTCALGKFGSCEGEVTPSSQEICGNKSDDNCNGEIDEGCCGNGITETGEACDEGSQNGLPGHCSATCTAPNCDDGNSCTDDFFDSTSGCLHTNNINACNDGNGCTTNDVCSEGKCRGDVDPFIGTACEEGILDAQCQTAAYQCVGGSIACIVTPLPNGTACDDGLFCNGEDACQNGSCQRRVRIMQIANNEISVVGRGCTAGEGLCQRSGETVCIEENDTYVCNAQAAPDGTSCSDQNACNGEEVCQGGSCQGGTPLTCDDGNICTDDFCDTTAGCLHPFNNYAESCYTGPAGTEDVGICRGGTAVCSGGVLGVCVGEMIPVTAEICGNGLDDNCNGEIDEGCDGEPQVIGKIDKIATYCGDGIKNGNEECDGADGVGPHQACSSECKVVNKTYCGDGIIQSPNDEGMNEECDGAAGVGSNEECSATCHKIQLDYCGDGIKNGNEECDGADGVGEHQECGSGCVLINLPYCGDGIQNGSETCDGADGVGEHQECTTECTLINLPYCGDGIRNGSETCDGADGVGPHQACSSNCELISLEFCGDGIKNGNEECDGNDGVGPHQVCSDSCALAPQTYCGDGIVQNPNDEGVFEKCDKPAAGIAAGVGPHQDCDENCRLINLTYCGDGIVQNPNSEGFSEECDLNDGVGEHESCSSECKKIQLDYCGDNIKNGNEECDGNDGVGEHQTCSDTCALINLTYCGDKIVQKPNDEGFSEECDGAEGVGPHRQCNKECLLTDLTYCGDGIIQNPNDEGIKEHCDGNEGVGPHQECNTTCGLTDLTYCGDGKLQSPNGEGNAEECDGNAGVGAHQECSSTCTLTDNSYCGDGVRQDPNDEGLAEECDGNDGVGEHESCSSLCKKIRLDYCGDGVKNGNEECDGADGIGDHQECSDTCAFINHTYCGDKIVQNPNDEGLDEKCDGQAGILPHTECNEKCRLTDLTYCGDGILQNPNDEGENEECDGADGVGEHQSCTNTCRLLDLTYCGDGILQNPNNEGLDEECDGEAGVGEHQECTPSCGLLSLTYCGDGTVQTPNGEGVAESCDTNAGVREHQTCSENCDLTHLTYCGDGVVQNPNDEGMEETCDGQTGVGEHQRCSTECKILNLTYCGDGIRQDRNDEGGEEACDGADGTGLHQSCSQTCTLTQLTYCGDGVVQNLNDEGFTEMCDGSAGPHQTCGENCQLTNLTYCGDGILQSPNDERIEESCDGAEGVIEHQTCSAGCELVNLSYCGDGIKQSPNNEGGEEACDGNDGTGPHQSCSHTCTLMQRTYCGDGIRQRPNDEGLTEACDGNDGVTGSHQVCNRFCEKLNLPFCGDGITDRDEECDDGNDVAEDACIDCIAARCGDGILYTGVESCDDGAANNDEVEGACNTRCSGFVTKSAPVCGNGVVEDFEECDDGNLQGGDRCSAICTIELTQKRPVCGDGVLDPGEECDDGNLESNDGCGPSCREEEVAELPTGECRSDIFDCSKTCSVLSPTVDVHTAVRLNPGDFENEAIVFSGGSGTSAQLAFKKTSAMNPDCRFAFQHCYLSTGPFRKTVAAPLDDLMQNDLVGITESNQYVYISDLDLLMSAQENNNCLLQPQPLAPNLTDERGESRIRHIYDMDVVMDDNTFHSLVASLQAGNAMAEEIGLDIFRKDGDRMQHTYQTVAGLEPGERVLDMEFENVDDEFLLMAALDNGDRIITKLFDCVFDETWGCTDTLTIENQQPLSLADMNTLRKRNGLAPVSDEENQLLMITKEGSVIQLSRNSAEQNVSIDENGEEEAEEQEEPAEGGGERRGRQNERGEKGRTHHRVHRVVTTNKVQRGKVQDEDFNPRGEEGPAFNEWLQTNAQNLMVGKIATITGYEMRTDEAGTTLIERLEHESLSADAPLNNVRNGEMRYLNPKFTLPLLRNNYGGTDMIAFFDVYNKEDTDMQNKEGTMVSIFHNVNESPEIALESQPPEGKQATIKIFPSDVMKDDLTCQTTLTDSMGNNLNRIIIRADCEEVVMDTAQVVDPDFNINTDVGKGAGKSSINVDMVSFPLSGTVCTTDPGNLSACAGFTIGKSGTAEITVPPTSTPATTVEKASPTYDIAGGGCGNIAQSGFEKQRPLNRVPFLLFGFLIILFGRFYRNWAGKRHCCKKTELPQ